MNLFILLEQENDGRENVDQKVGELVDEGVVEEEDVGNWTAKNVIFSNSKKTYGVKK